MKSKSNVLEYLAEAAKRRPGDTAVVDEFGSYTYKQLQDDSAAYGAALSEYDVANRGVVIMVEKCYDTLAIMLGTLFASGYYVPVDPSVPPVRLAHIVATLGSPLLVADEEALRGLQLEDACKIVSLEELHSQRAGIQQRDAVEPGQKGEIIVRGPSLALGYIGNREATEKAFAPNPLNSLYGERVYRTGDSAMLTDEGDLVFCGRKDNQIKYRGHRIELEEIDKAFEGFSDVDRCRCAFDSKKNRLCAFYEGTACEKELPGRAASLLPAFMRPTRIAKVPSMPLNKNGKVDRAMLLESHGEPAKRERADR